MCACMCTVHVSVPNITVLFISNANIYYHKLTALPMDMKQQHLPSLALYVRYEHLLQEFVLENTPGVVYCPRPGCQSRVFSEPDDSLAVCDTCRYPFCKDCNHLWHAPQPCRVTSALVRVMWTMGQLTHLVYMTAVLHEVYCL